MKHSDDEAERIEGLSCQLNCESRCIDFLRSAVAVMAERAGMDAHWRNRVTLAVDELFANIAEHGYRGRPGTIEFSARIESMDTGGRCLSFEFRDYADNAWRYDETELSARSAGEPTPGGLGLRLIREVTDEFVQTRLADGSRWRLSFTLQGKTAAPEKEQRRSAGGTDI